jgi:hypothetical protein
VLEALGERGLAPLEESHIACERAGLAEPPRAIGIAYAREVPGGGFLCLMGYSCAFASSHSGDVSNCAHAWRARQRFLCRAR